MKRIACGVLILVVWGVPALAQRRLGENRDPRQNPNVVDATQLQWLMLTGPGVPVRTTSSPGGPASAGAPGAAAGTVSVSELRIPEGAVKEMMQFQKKYEAGKLEESVKHLEKAIHIYPQWAAAHHNLGQCYAQLHEYDKAITEFQSAASLDAKLPQPWASMAGVHFLQGHYADGESAARRALDIDPVNGNARYFLGRILAVEGHDIPQAIELLRKSQDEYPQAHLVLANVYLKRNAVEAAVEELRGYIAQPNAPQKEKVACMVEQLTQPEGKANCAMQ